jgi:ribosomal protein S6--L-glutamate ligase
MRLVTFDPLRALDIPGAAYIKPEQMFQQRNALFEADWVLFPQSWQIHALQYGFKVRIFPSIAGYDLGMNKIEMTRAFWAVCPENVPHTLILPNNPNGREQVLDEMNFPLVLKEPVNSMGRGVFLLESPAEFSNMTGNMEVLYIQEYVPIDEELRIVVVGDGIVAAYWKRGGDGFHHNIAQGARADFEAIPEAALRLVESVARELGIDHAGFDVAMVDGHPFLFELNVLFGNQVLNARGIRLGPIIIEHLQKRLRLPAPHAAESKLTC